MEKQTDAIFDLISLVKTYVESSECDINFVLVTAVDTGDNEWFNSFMSLIQGAHSQNAIINALVTWAENEPIGRATLEKVFNKLK